MSKRQFASDNYAGTCPEALEFFLKANEGYAPSYGEDAYTEEASNLFRELFENDRCEIFFVFNGTAANSLALASLCQSYHSIICHRLAHIETDECGGPEFFSNGSKILLGDGRNGKLSAGDVELLVKKRSDIHYPKPKVLSLTQSTELGTVYHPDDLAPLQAVAQRYQLKIHMDGARFANAVAALDRSPADLTWRAGVDVLCFGGAKNGLPLGEAVIFFNPELAEDFAYRCKQAGQLASKMRFLAAPWIGLLKDQIWLRNAQNANQCARYLADQIEALPEVELIGKTEANAVFLQLPAAAMDQLRRRGWSFYTFIGPETARLMCSWNTKPEDVDHFVTELKECLI